MMADRAERAYRRLLFILPASLREDAEPELVETFRAAHARLGDAGALARLAFWWRMAADAVVTAIAERATLWRRRPALTLIPSDRPPVSRNPMELLREVRHAARSLIAHRGFSATAVLTIALGIGASVAIFSVVNAVLLKPLPYRDPGQLVLVWQELGARGVKEFPFPPGDIPDLRLTGTVFDDVMTLQSARQTVTIDAAGPEYVRTLIVSSNAFDLLGFRMAAGRTFEPNDSAPFQPPATPGAQGGQPPPVFSVILSHEYWQRRFSGDPSIIGRSMQFSGPSALVVGVVEPGAELLYAPRLNVERTPDIWVAARTNYATGTRTAGSQRVIGRLRPDVTVAQAQAQMDGLAAELRETYPVKKNAGVEITVVPMHASLVADVRTAIVALMGAVTFVLLIACANVANLTMTQTLRRERDFAVRTALGAGRSVLVRQLLFESLLVAAIGTLVGLGLAWVGIVSLQAIGPASLPRLEAVAIDWTVLLFAAAAAVVSAVLFGLLPAWRASRTSPAHVLQRGSRAAGLGSGRLGGGLVVAEVALTFVLLVGAGLMTRTLVELHEVEPGFEPRGLLTFFIPDVSLGASSFEGRMDAVARLREALRALPGVENVSAASPLPLDGQNANVPYGTDASDPTEFQQAIVHAVQPGYFETMGTRVLEGRMFETTSEPRQSLEVVVDHLLAERAYPGESAVGKPLLLRVGGNDPTRFEIVGVVEHQRHASLASPGREALFLPEGRMGFASRWVVRASGDPLRLADSVRDSVRRVNPRVVVTDLQPMQAFVDRAQAPTRFTLMLIGVFAAIAVVMAIVGLYGVLATMVRQRTAEIGVRLTFGAERQSIFRLIIGRGLKLALAGIAIGMVGAVALTGTIRTLLVGVDGTDPLTFGTIAALFVGVAAAACGLPAYRASRLDPVVALRNE